MGKKNCSFENQEVLPTTLVEMAKTGRNMILPHSGFFMYWEDITEILGGGENFQTGTLQFFLRGGTHEYGNLFYFLFDRALRTCENDLHQVTTVLN